MLVGIHKDPFGRFSAFLERYEKILDFNGVAHIRLDASQPDFWERVSELNLFIFRWRQYDDERQMAKAILPIVEREMHIKCFPDLATCWHYDDKIRQYYLLKEHGYPIIQSWVFWDKKAALKWLESASFPLVFKLKGGAGSNNVILIKGRPRAKRLVRRMFGKGMLSGHIPGIDTIRFKDFILYKAVRKMGGNLLRAIRGEDISLDWQVHKNYCYFQKYLPNNNFDTRVTIIGERAFAFRRLSREKDFRSSGSGKIDYDINKIDVKFLQIALKVSKEMRFQSMAYDFLYNERGEQEFCEISYTYLDTAVYNCPGYWDSGLNWHEGHYWPQYFQLMDLLALSDLKQPVP